MSASPEMSRSLPASSRSLTDLSGVELSARAAPGSGHSSTRSTPRASDADEKNSVTVTSGSEPHHTVVNISEMERASARVAHRPPPLLSEIKSRPSLYVPPLPHPSFQPDTNASTGNDNGAASLPVSYQPHVNPASQSHDKVAMKYGTKGWVYSDKHSAYVNAVHTTNATNRNTDTRIALIEHQSKQQRGYAVAMCILLTIVTLLTIVAFVGTVAYLTHSIDQQIGDQQITGAMLANGAVTSDKLAPRAVTPVALAPTLTSLLTTLNTSYDKSLELLPGAGKGLTENSTTHTLSLSIDTNTLTITNTNTLSLQAQGIKQQHLAANSVTSQQLANSSVTEQSLADGSVGASKLGSDVRSMLATMNDTARLALAGVAVSGNGINVTDNHTLNLNIDTNYFIITTANTLSIRAYSLGTDTIVDHSVGVDQLSEAVMAKFPTAGRGLVQSSASSGVLSINVDNSSIIVDAGSNSVRIGARGVTSAMIADGAVTSDKLSATLLASFDAINNTAESALFATEQLFLSQSFLQQQLLHALNISDSELLGSLSMTSRDLYDAITAVNTTTYQSLANVNYTVFDLASEVETDTRILEEMIVDTYDRLYSEIPTSGEGLYSAGTTMNVRLNDSVLAFSDSGAIIVIERSLTADYLSSGAVTSDKLADSAVSNSKLADGSVSIGKLGSDLGSLVALLNGGVSGTISNTLTLGTSSSDVTITRTSNGGNLILGAVQNGSVSLTSANGIGAVQVNSDQSVFLGSSSTTMVARTGNVQLSAQSGLVQLNGQSVNATANSGASLLQLTSMNALLASQSLMTLSAPSINIASTSTVSVTAPLVTFNAPITYKSVSVSVSAAVYAVDFSAVSATNIRLTDTNASTGGYVNITASRCTDATAGLTVNLYNQLASQSSLYVPGSYCNRAYDLIIAPGQRVSMTCMGAPLGIDCQHSERASGGYQLPSTVQTITNNIASGAITTSTATGTVRLVFTPVNNNPIIKFNIQSALFSQGSTALLLTPKSSGFVNTFYSSGLETPVWVVANQALSGGSMLVTLVNVGDALYSQQQQTLEFLYTIV